MWLEIKLHTQQQEATVKGMMIVITYWPQKLQIIISMHSLLFLSLCYRCTYIALTEILNTVCGESYITIIVAQKERQTHSVIHEMNAAWLIHCLRSDSPVATENNCTMRNNITAHWQ